MGTDERRQLIKTIGAPATYMTELSKELKGVEYDRLRKKNKTQPRHGGGLGKAGDFFLFCAGRLRAIF